MDPKQMQMILQLIQLSQVLLPQLLAMAQHYGELKDDPNLSETDKAKMVANLQALQLKDWDSL